MGASYTKRSWWQLSNSEESSPFREINYEPPLFIGWATDYDFAGWTLRDVKVGLNHQSNGRSDPTSRSCNRAYTRLMAQNGNWQVEVKPWLRLDDSSDNHDIIKCMGHYRLKIDYAWGGEHLQRGRALQLEQRLRRRATGLELSCQPPRAFLYPAV